MLASSLNIGWVGWGIVIVVVLFMLFVSEMGYSEACPAAFSLAGPGTYLIDSLPSSIMWEAFCVDLFYSELLGLGLEFLLGAKAVIKSWRLVSGMDTVALLLVAILVLLTYCCWFFIIPSAALTVLVLVLWLFAAGIKGGALLFAAFAGPLPFCCLSLSCWFFFIAAYVILALPWRIDSWSCLLFVYKLMDWSYICNLSGLWWMSPCLTAM